MMQCEQFEALLHLWLDGELDEGSRRQLEEHTVQCAACAQRKQALEAFLAVCDDMGSEEVVPEAAAVGWRQAIRQEAAQRDGMAQRARPRRGTPVWRTWATVAAGIMVWLGGTVLVHNSPLGTGNRQAENAPLLFGEARKSEAMQNTAPESAMQPFVPLAASEADTAESEEMDGALPYAEDSALTGEAPRAYAAVPELEAGAAPRARAAIEPTTAAKEGVQALADTEGTQRNQRNGWRGYLQDAGIFLLMCLPVAVLVAGITGFVRKRRRKK